MNNKRLLKDLRELVKTIKAEGFTDDVFGFAFGKEDGKLFLQAWSYDFVDVDLGESYAKSWEIAKKVLADLEVEYKGECECVNCLVDGEVKESVFLEKKVLMVMNLNM